MLMLHYNIPEFDDCDSFLALLAKRSGRMKKGGRPDLNAAAKQVLNDWNSGKLHYFTEPPEQQIVSEFQPELVSEFVKEFDLDNLEENIRVLVDSLPDQRMVSVSAYDASLPISFHQKLVKMHHKQRQKPFFGQAMLKYGRNN
uniref:Uncharacterized protein n=1 Tax=Meloidogyne enterolobii TaxID=390850 RepID=A0A6V7VEH7_MELEN|nr:unnamed protein product [Meloidogyne enterolobii]